MKFNFINIAALAGTSLLVLQLLNQKPKTNKGLRNNNAGNIRRTKNLWTGEVPHHLSTDKSFKQFASWTFGVRAMIGLLYRYYTKYNKKTIRSIVYMYAPPSDNNWSEQYVSMVVNDTGISADTTFNFNIANVMKIVKAMTKVELGGRYVSNTEFVTAWNLFMIAPNKP